MEKLKIEPTPIQENLDNRYKTLGGCEENTYDSEPDPPLDLIFLMPLPSPKKK